MRPVWVGLLSLTAASAFPQVGVGRAVQTGVRYLVENGYARQPVGGLRNPMQPGGFNGLPAREGDLPPAQPDEKDSKDFKVIKSGKTTHKGDEIEITGPLHCRYQGYDIFGDKLSGNKKTEIYNISGDAKLVGEDGVVKGKFIEVNFKTKKFRALDSNVDVRPSVFEGKVKDDVYVKGRETEGGKEQVLAKDGSLTTCNYDHPHFEIRSRDIDVKPGQRAILRHAEIIVLGKRLLSIPYLSIPLKDRDARSFPEVGENRDEGYYVKTRIGVELKRHDGFDALVDYMSKLGLGLGGQYDYKTKLTQGRTRLYAVLGGANTYDVVSRHQQKFGSVQFSLDNSIQHRNYMNAPKNTLVSTRLQLRLPQKFSQTQISFFRSSNEQPGFNYGQQTVGFSDQRTWSKALRTNLDVNWVNSSSHYNQGTPVRREQIDVRFSATQELRVATALLEYQRSIPVGENANFLNSSDRTPVLTLRSDAGKIFGAKSAVIPFQTSLSVGEFMDPTNKRHVSRGAFSLEFQHGGGGSYGGAYGGGYGGGYGGSYGGGYGGYTGAFSTQDYTPTSVRQPTVAPGKEVPTATAGGAVVPPGPAGTPGAEVQKKKAPSRLSLSLGGRFNQGIYSDDTAQYTTGLNSGLRYDLGRGSGLNVRYSYLQSHGYSPLQVDRFGATNLISFDLSLKPVRSLTLAAQSSYDFRKDQVFTQSRWQMVGLRTEWTPRDWFQMRTLTTYDTFQQKVGTIRLDVGYKPGATYVGLGARYDGIRHTWSNTSLFIEGLKWHRLKISSLLIYNGYLEKFEARHFSFTYDLHCAEAILQIIDNPVGFRSGTQIVFMIRLKAFPFDTPFGTGQRGQPLGIGAGREY